MIYDESIETRPPAEQFALDRQAYRGQLRYLFQNSIFYKKKLGEAGFETAEAVGELDALSQLPFTEKDELRATQAEHPPFGEHLACAPERLQRVFSTSGTTGVPCYLGLTPNDIATYATHVARGYTAGGFRRGQRVVVGFNAGPFVAGGVFYGFDKMGLCVVPVGTGNTERMVTAIRKLGASGVSCTPSYGLYLIDWCREHRVETRALGLTHMIAAGEPGGGDPMIRNKIQEAFGCTVRESMGIGDVSLSTWAEDDDGRGMHFMARGAVHVELIDPVSGEPKPWEHKAEGELVYTALKREAMPLLRFRSRDHVVVNMEENPTGRTGPRIRCIGRTDDMLIVRGVNLFPSAIRSIIKDFVPDLSGFFQVRPKVRGVSQVPPLPLQVELGHEFRGSEPALRERLQQEIRSRLLVSSDITLVRHGAIPRGTYKTRLVEYADDAGSAEGAKG